MAVKGGACRIQPARQPSGGYGAGGLVNQRRVVAFDDAVVVGQKEKRFGIGLLAGGNGRTDGTDIVAQVRNAGGGDAGKDALLGFTHKKATVYINQSK